MMGTVVCNSLGALTDASDVTVRIFEAFLVEFVCVIGHGLIIKFHNKITTKSDYYF